MFLKEEILGASFMCPGAISFVYFFMSIQNFQNELSVSERLFINKISITFCKIVSLKLDSKFIRNLIKYTLEYYRI